MARNTQPLHIKRPVITEIVVRLNASATIARVRSASTNIAIIWPDQPPTANSYKDALSGGTFLSVFRHRAANGWAPYEFFLGHAAFLPAIRANAISNSSRPSSGLGSIPDAFANSSIFR